MAENVKQADLHQCRRPAPDRVDAYQQEDGEVKQVLGTA